MSRSAGNGGFCRALARRAWIGIRKNQQTVAIMSRASGRTSFDSGKEHRHMFVVGGDSEQRLRARPWRPFDSLSPDTSNFVIRILHGENEGDLYVMYVEHNG